ncbi:hypothetical protein D917_00812 [Trichinella nativa]|uniref:Uncharacterized protein n=1 Tax=Trichinella nativa TaxID=6335 RepID=A0A1Y3E460_9BILA|nr:hypothetical protein D917_00812 [Trichinella nativa]
MLVPWNWRPPFPEFLRMVCVNCSKILKKPDAKISVSKLKCAF